LKILFSFALSICNYLICLHENNAISAMEAIERRPRPRQQRPFIFTNVIAFNPFNHDGIQSMQSKCDRYDKRNSMRSMR